MSKQHTITFDVSTNTLAKKDKSFHTKHRKFITDEFKNRIILEQNFKKIWRTLNCARISPS